MLWQTVQSLSDNSTELDTHTRNLRQALLAIGSETPDNLQCVADLDFGPIEDGAGLRLSKLELPISDLAYELENLPLPAELKSRFPGLEERDWEAFGRLVTLLLISISKITVPQMSDRAQAVLQCL